jgi:hypothetical protein
MEKLGGVCGMEFHRDDGGGRGSRKLNSWIPEKLAI